MIREISVIIPYYRQPLMLRKQLDTVAEYPKEYKIIVVDDCSPEPAKDVLRESDNIELYRIETDIPWNRGGARNLGATVAETDWIIQVDTDHILPPECAERLLRTDVNPDSWYRFPRYRVGKADETRRKDAIPDDCEFGEIKPHIDSYLISREMFLSSPYDEDYSGCLGGGSPFLARMSRIAPVHLLPEDICLHVYTRSVIRDASISTLNRDTSEYKRRRAEKEKKRNTSPGKIIRFGWKKVR